MNMNRLQTLELLVDELMKEKPEEKLVKSYMQETGLQYTLDPIDRLNTVLKALHFKEGDKVFVEEKIEEKIENRKS